MKKTIQLVLVSVSVVVLSGCAATVSVSGSVLHGDNVISGSVSASTNAVTLAGSDMKGTNGETGSITVTK